MGQLVLEGPAAFPMLSAGITGGTIGLAIRDFTDIEGGQHAPKIGFAAGVGGVAFLIFAWDNFVLG